MGMLGYHGPPLAVFVVMQGIVILCRLRVRCLVHALFFEQTLVYCRGIVILRRLRVRCSTHTLFFEQSLLY